MKNFLMMMGLITASLVPLAASAHANVRLGLNIGLPLYVDRSPGYYEPEVVVREYGPPRPVYYHPYRHFYRADYYYRPRIVYREYYRPRYWHHHYDRDGD